VLGVIIVASIALVVAEYYLSPRPAFVCAVLLLVTISILLGWLMGGRPLGILVNEQNLMSLSRFQLLGWTIVILAAYMTYAFQRLQAGTPNALAVVVDKSLWALMGISTVSLVGSATVTSVKSGQEPDADAAKRTAPLTGDASAQTVLDNSRGTLYANARRSEAAFTDLFEGDEVGNAGHVSLGKLQMFYLTIIILSGYMFMVLKSLHANPDTGSLPILSEGVIALMGISHAGYLSTKAVNHTELKSDKGIPLRLNSDPTLSRPHEDS
jgi:hypothetical protein